MKRRKQSNPIRYEKLARQESDDDSQSHTSEPGAPHITRSSGDETSRDSVGTSRSDSPSGHQMQNQEADFLLPISIPNVPPLVSAGNGQPAALSMQGMFPNHMSPFLFPVMSHPAAGQSPHSMQGSGGSIPTNGGGFRIFNPEAYCDLCHKEFCNKYFLKTHKANKHGIYSMDTQPSTGAFTSPTVTASTTFFPANLTDTAATLHMQQFLQQSTSPLSTTVPAQVASALAARGLGMVNVESYCEICQKEFCNKYFLRKHKRKIHGITESPSSQHSVGSPASSSGGGDISSSRKTMSSPTSPSVAPSASPPPIEEKEATENEDLRIQNHQHPQQQQHPRQQQTPNREQSHPHPQQQQSDQASQDLQKLQSMIRELSASSSNMANHPWDRASCSICRQECENRYVLKSHMATEHNLIAHDDPPPDQRNLIRSLFDPNRGFPAVSAAQCLLGVVRTGSACDTTSEAFCEICQKEFCSKYFLKSHKENQHGITAESPPPPPPPPPTASQSPGNHSGPEANSPNEKSNSSHVPISSPSVAVPQGPVKVPTTITGPDGKPRVLTGRNYCNICNKELCNKYFMKTHMLKMHGINIDEHPAEAQMTSTIGGVSCDICQKELCSKYFLKVHKQNTHGIYDDSSIVSRESRTMNGSTRVSSDRDKDHAPPDKRESIQQPPTPVLPPMLHQQFQVMQSVGQEAVGSERSENHSPGIDPSDTNNRYFSHYTEVCPLCERRFKSIKWLKTHIVNDHRTPDCRDSDPLPEKKEVNQQPSPPLMNHDKFTIVGNTGVEAKDENHLSPANDSSCDRAANHFREVCPLCERRFRSIKWLKAHIVNDHSDFMGVMTRILYILQIPSNGSPALWASMYLVVIPLHVLW